MYQKDLSDDNYIEILFLIRLCKRDGKGEISWYIIAGFLFLFFLVSIDLVFVMNLSLDGVTLRFLDSLVFVVKKCTHRGCKILVSTMYFLFCSKNQTISKQRAHRPIPMWSFEANDNGFANFFLKMCIWFTTCKCSYRDYLNCYHNWQDLWKNVAVFLYAKY